MTQTIAKINSVLSQKQFKKGDLKISRSDQNYQRNFKFLQAYIRNIFVLQIDKHSKPKVASENPDATALQKNPSELNSNAENNESSNHQEVDYTIEVLDIIVVDSVTKILDAVSHKVKEAAKDAVKENDKTELLDSIEATLLEFFKEELFINSAELFSRWIASEYRHIMSKRMNRIYASLQKLLSVLLEYSNIFYNCWMQEKGSMDQDQRQKICGINEDRESSFSYILKHKVKLIAWTLSKVSHSLIKIDASEKKEEKMREKQNLMEATVMSGGLEHRFLHCFSEDTKTHIRTMCDISQDDTLVKHMDDIKLIDEDRMFMDLIYEGRNASVDTLIDFLQWHILRRNPVMKVGGADGMILSRCAFASNLSLNRYHHEFSYDNLLSLLETIQVADLSGNDNNNANEKYKKLVEELKDLKCLKAFQDRWEKASKIRVWLQEKKKDISNNIRNEVNVTSGTDNIEESKIDNNGEEVIDTSTKQNDKLSEKDLMQREKEEIKKLVKDVCLKAELLIKLEPPKVWAASDKSKSNLRMLSENSFVKLKDIKMTFVKNLKTIQSIRESKGTVVSYEDIANKDVFNSCTTSVQAVLQCSLTADDILKALELRYVNAIHRYCGLKFFHSLISLDIHTDELIVQMTTWFKSAFTQIKKTELCHYTDDIKGADDDLIQQIRVVYFQIYEQLVSKMNEMKSPYYINLVLSQMIFLVSQDDLDYILKTGIIEFLSGESHPLSLKCWNLKLDLTDKFKRESYSYYKEIESIDQLIYIIVYFTQTLISQVISDTYEGNASVKNGEVKGSSLGIERTTSVTDSDSMTNYLQSCF